MSIRPLSHEKDIAAAYAMFAQYVAEGSEEFSREISSQGETITATVYWHEALGFWALLQPQEKQYLCAFGTDDPRSNPTLSIICEINPLRQGFSRQHTGIFIQDSNGHMYLAHSGKIGGSRPPAGKPSFLKSRDDCDLAPVIFSDKIEHEYIVVGRLDDSGFLADLARFVSSVEEYKKQ